MRLIKLRIGLISRVHQPKLSPLTGWPALRDAQRRAARPGPGARRPTVAPPTGMPSPGRMARRLRYTDLESESERPLSSAGAQHRPWAFSLSLGSHLKEAALRLSLTVTGRLRAGSVEKVQVDLA
jgi:hypothetical protein